MSKIYQRLTGRVAESDVPLMLPSFVLIFHFMEYSEVNAMSTITVTAK